jgi:CPA2 family monovalent cation:H+ antiporter-2
VTDTVLFQAFVYLCAAVVCVPIAKRLGLGAVLGYLVAGVLVGPTCSARSAARASTSCTSPSSAS